MRARVATVTVILMLTALAAVVGYISHPSGVSEFGNLGRFRGYVQVCRTPDRCAIVRADAGSRVAVVVRRANPNSGASIGGTFGLQPDGTFAGSLNAGTYRATIRPATRSGLRAETVVITLTAGRGTPFNLAYRP